MFAYYHSLFMDCENSDVILLALLVPVFCIASVLRITGQKAGFCEQIRRKQKGIAL